jgi:biopolymer transport protein ExbD
MAAIRKKGDRPSPAISTASLPDIVFMLLFFFMVTTSMKEVDLRVRTVLPEATEVKKLEDKANVSYIYVGTPHKKYWGKYGKEARMQINDQFAELQDIAPYIEGERKQRDPSQIPKMTTALKVDSEAKMGIVTDIKQELRKVNALKLNYTTRKKYE